MLLTNMCADMYKILMVRMSLTQLISCQCLPEQVGLSAALYCLQKAPGLGVSPPQTSHVCVVAEPDT